MGVGDVSDSLLHLLACFKMESSCPYTTPRSVHAIDFHEVLAF